MTPLMHSTPGSLYTRQYFTIQVRGTDGHPGPRVEGTWKIRNISEQDNGPKMASRGLENKNYRAEGDHIVISNSIMNIVEISESFGDTGQRFGEHHHAGL